MVPDSGIVEIHNADFYFETSIAVFSMFLTTSSLILSLIILFIFWILRLPGTLKSAFDNYFYKKKVVKMLDVMYLAETGKLKEASKKYDKKDFEIMEHDMVKRVQNHILDFQKKSK
ncbi:MAG: hypothetical protein K0T99_03310 [Alphaproteobacteria bacterium]|nr:hypothetical protein [Alphaproteobacteria bacterium]